MRRLFKNAKGNFKVSRKSFVMEHDKSEKFSDHYKLKEQLGSGNYGTVHACLHMESSDIRAVKILAKAKIQDDSFRNEIDTLKELDHPNILRIFESFEDDKNYYVVTEFCDGGELFEEILEWGKFTEEDAAVLMKQILTCVNYCHRRNFVHRDLKPENILLEKDKGFDHLKICDFGTAKLFDEEAGGAKNRLKDSVGSPYYIAPEVLAGSYGAKCDVWSCGVIAYIVLSGVPPFNGHSDEEIYDRIMEGRYNFDGDEWSDISDEAIDFICNLLTYEEKDRPDASEALTHKWLDAAKMEAHDNYSSKEAISSLSNLASFSAQQKLKQATYTFIVSQLLTKDEKEGVDAIFRAMDVDCDGKLSRDEIKLSWNEHFGQALGKEELETIFQQVDSDESGEIDYSEFVMATMNARNLVSEKRLEAAFRAFDKDGNGQISPEEVRQILGGGVLDEKAVAKIIAQVDADGDGQVNFAEFKTMMVNNLI